MWVRLHYVYPYPHVDEVIPLMAEGKILPYLDVPFQHASPRILKLMKRPASTEKNLERIRALARGLPRHHHPLDLHRRLPGRDRGRVRGAARVPREAQLDRVGCFAYSPVEGAKANELPGAVPEEVREERRARFMAGAGGNQPREARAQGGTHDRGARRRGRGRHGDRRAARADAPEIDGVVRVKGAEGAKPGDFLRVRVTAADEHDLQAVPA